MKSRDTTKNHLRGDELYQLLCIVLVIAVSLIAWAIQEYRDKQSPKMQVEEFLDILSDIEFLKPNSVKHTPNLRQMPFKKEKAKPKTRKVVCINSADSAALESMPVFGPVLASRTMKFRNALGGFYNIEQLKEVYGLDSLGFEKVKLYLDVDTTMVDQICINQTDFYALKSHPYLSYKEAKLILRFLEHNELSKVDELESQPFLNDGTFKKKSSII